MVVLARVVLVRVARIRHLVLRGGDADAAGGADDVGGDVVGGGQERQEHGRLAKERAWGQSRPRQSRCRRCCPRPSVARMNWGWGIGSANRKWPSRDSKQSRHPKSAGGRRRDRGDDASVTPLYYMRRGEGVE